MLLGINGPLKSGKNTVFDIIKELYPQAECVSFAESLKVSATELLKIDRELLDELKNNEAIKLVWTVPPDAVYDDIFEKLQGWEMNGREFLQRYGDESHREVFGLNFWVDQVLPADLDHSERLIVVTDMRYLNEVDRIRELNGLTWKIVRKTVSKHLDHPSESTNINEFIDVFIDNDGTLEELKQKIKNNLKNVV